jgi:hypothetical protein
MRECSDILQGHDHGASGEEAAAALVRSLGFEKVTVVGEQPSAT